MKALEVANIELIHPIGSGSYAIVYKAVKVTTHETFAVKIIQRCRLTKTSWDNLIREITLLRVLQHKHIVQMHDLLVDAANIYIVMEYCNAGNLSAYIRQQKTLDELTCRRFLQQLTLALFYMRERGVSHMDLKPANLLLTIEAATTVLKIGDFGFAEYLEPHEQHKDVKGTPLYMAPEILLTGVYGPPADLWSVGVILYECLFGSAPHSTYNLKQLAVRHKSKKPIVLPSTPPISEDCRMLLHGLLQHNPSDRITFKKFFDDPFIDIAHMASPQNLLKASLHIAQASALDDKQDWHGAYQHYCQGLQYYVPIARDEPNWERKQELRQRVQGYLTRAEELKALLPEKAKVNQPQPSTSTQGTSGMADSQAMIALHPSIKQAIAKGMELAHAAETYTKSNQMDEALKNYTAALELLLPVLHQNLPLDMKAQLHDCVKNLLEEAEHVKTLRSAQLIQEMTCTEDKHDGCIVQ